MSYDKTLWVNDKTVITAENMNKIEDCLEQHTNDINTHVHTKSEIVDFPKTMPAYGGNSDTVGGKEVNDTKTDESALWTAKKIKTELDKKSNIHDHPFAPTVHRHIRSEILDFAHTHSKNEIPDFTHNHYKNEIIDFAHNHYRSEIIDFPTSLPASDVPSWAKQPNKPSYSASEVGAIPTSASCNKNWNWSGQGGQPSWLWGGNDGTNMYVYNPSNFRVANANTVADVGIGNLAKQYVNANGVDINDTNLKQFYGTCVTQNGSAPNTDWWHIINVPHADNNGYGAQLALGYHGQANLMVRSASGTSWGAWYDVIGNIESLKSTVVSGKTSIANAINAKAGTSLTNQSSFEEMANAINSISVKKPADLYSMGSCKITGSSGHALGSYVEKCFEMNTGRTGTIQVTVQPTSSVSGLILHIASGSYNNLVVNTKISLLTYSNGCYVAQARFSNYVGMNLSTVSTLDKGLGINYSYSIYYD